MTHHMHFAKKKGKQSEERVANCGEAALVCILNAYCHKYDTNYNTVVV